MPSRAVVWKVLAVAVALGWLAVAGIGGQKVGSLSQVQENSAEAFLPSDAESTRAAQAQRELSGATGLPVFIVAERADGLTDTDLGTLQEFAADVPDVPVADVTLENYLSDATVPVIPSEDGTAALLPVSLDQADVRATLPDGEQALNLAVANLRSALSDDVEGGGLETWATGPGAQAADLVEAFGAIDSLLLLVALSVVFLILVVVYRSPVLPILVLLTSVSGLAAAGYVVYELADAGTLTLDGQGQGILFILVVGAATDYSLLLVARYREELSRHQSTLAALRSAWRASLEPIAASAGTVVAGLLCLLLSDLNSNRSLGPVAAIGIGGAFLAALTLLPALLLAGRWVFWPRVPHAKPGAELSPEQAHPAWHQVGTAVSRRPRAIWVTTVLVLGAAAAAVPTFQAEGTRATDVFLAEVESVEGQDVLAEHFAAGSGDPLVVIAAEGDADEALTIVGDTQGIASVSPVTDEAGLPGAPAPPGAEPRVVDGRVELRATLSTAVDSPEALETVRTVRHDLAEAGLDTLVGGTSATRLDTQDTAARDRTLIIPLVLVVVLLILMLLLRAVVAGLILILANVLSFGAALGVSAIVFNHVLNFPGADATVPLFAFVFLVALGVDYSIFLMTRVREESIRRGTRAGVVTGVTVTGGVITSAGVVLAATFGALGVVPLLFLAQLAFIVAFGVLLDTFIVRSLLVPAITYELGDRVWWPSRLSR